MAHTHHPTVEERLALIEHNLADLPAPAACCHDGEHNHVEHKHISADDEVSDIVFDSAFTAITKLAEVVKRGGNADAIQASEVLLDLYVSLYAGC